MRSTLTTFTEQVQAVCIAHDELVSTWMIYCYIHTYSHARVHKYSNFLVGMISVGLSSARSKFI